MAPRLPRTVVGLHSHSLRHDLVEQLLRHGGIERLQVLVDDQRLTLLASLQVREAKSKPGTRKLRIDPQRPTVGFDGLGVLAGVVIGKAQVVPGLGKLRIDLQRARRRRSSTRGVLHRPAGGKRARRPITFLIILPYGAYWASLLSSELE